MTLNPQKLNSLFAELCLRWNFEPECELPGGHCSRVWASDDSVLKIPFQGEERTTGLRASLLLQGHGGPHIHQSDPESGSMLMQRIQPGNKLSDSPISEQQAREITADFIRHFRGLPADQMLPLSDFGYPECSLLKNLTADGGEHVFLHGDLHHENILRSADGWALIDPKGLCGDPAYEVVAFLRNPIGRLPSGGALKSLIIERIKWFADDLDLDPWRIAAWLTIDMMNPSEPWHELSRITSEVLDHFEKC